LQPTLKIKSQLLFNASGLSRGVRLTVVDPNKCEQAFMDLRREYETARERSSLGSEIWRGKNNLIKAIDLRHERSVIKTRHITCLNKSH
jgi:hypothetical protein